MEACARRLTQCPLSNPARGASDSNLGTDTCKEGPGSHPHVLFLPFLGSPQAGMPLLGSPQRCDLRLR